MLRLLYIAEQVGKVQDQELVHIHIGARHQLVLRTQRETDNLYGVTIDYKEGIRGGRKSVLVVKVVKLVVKLVVKVVVMKVVVMTVAMMVNVGHHNRDTQ